MTTQSNIMTILLLAVVLPAFLVTANIDASHVRFVDYDNSTGNFLFRMGLPANGTHALAVDQMHALFAARAKAAGVQFFASRDQYQLVDVNLLTTESGDINKERDFFAANPSTGSFVHWPIYGITEGFMQKVCKQMKVSSCDWSTRQPKDFKENDRKVLSSQLLQWDVNDHLDTLVGQLASWLHTPPQPEDKDTRPKVIFGHCECGCDRTGEVFAAYYMRYQQWSWWPTIDYDFHVPNRHIDYPQQVMAQWYCQYLVAQGTANYTDCAMCNNPKSKTQYAACWGLP